MSRLARWIAVALVGAVTAISVIPDAEARRGGSFGSRGSRTYEAPAPTRTAPQPAQPIQRSTAPQQAPASAAAPSAAAAQAARPSMFGSGFAGNLMRGLLIGGLIGALMGYGFGGLAGMLGFLLQAGLIMLAVVLLMRLFAARRQTAAAGAPGRFDNLARGTQWPGPAPAGFGLGGGATRPAATPVATTPITLAQQDFETFERLLGDVQTALGRQDMDVIRASATPEVADVLAEDFAEARQQGLVTEISDVKLLQGDLSEAWREGRDDYATVAMRFAIREVTREAATGRVVAGDPDQTGELTEIWTFVRHDGGPWKLSAIQEA